MNESEAPADAYGRFESLAQEIVATPKPPAESADPAGEPSDDDAEREHQ